MHRRSVRTADEPTPSLKQLQIDGLAHRLVAGVIWMEVVAAVIGCGDRGRTSCIGKNAIEVDDAVEGAARPYPVIDGLAFCLLVGREISLIRRSREGIFEWRQRTAHDLDRAEMGSFDQLLVAGNDLVRSANYAARLDRGTRPADVVDPDEDHDVRNAGLAQHAAFESSERADAGAVAKDTIACDPLVLDRNGNPGLFQPACEYIRPATVGINGRGGPVGNRISKRYNRPYRRTGLDHDARQEEPICKPVYNREFGTCRKIARGRNIGGLKPGCVNRPEVRSGRQIQAHCEVGKGSDIQLRRIAQGRGTRRNNDRLRTPECKRTQACRSNIRTCASHCDAGGSY